jgi:CRISPR/Cas system-associated exonuclease Cas4 (RecB family)
MEKSGSLSNCDFSVSDVISAFKCPLQFYFSKKSIVAHFYFSGNNLGSFVHKVLSTFAKNIGTYPLFESGKNIVEEALYKSFYEVATSRKYKTNLEIAWQHIKPISIYFETIAQNRTTDEIRSMFILSEQPFTVNFYGTNICGRFDILLHDGEKIRIIDYKTRDREIEIDAVQIALYKYAVEKITGLRPEPAIIYVLDGEVKEEVFTEEEYKMLLKRIAAEISDMKLFLSGKKIPKKTPDRSLCKHCSLRNSCSALYEKFFG